MDALQAAQANHCQHLVAKTQNLAMVDAMNLFPRDPRNFHDRRDRHGEQTSADAEEQGLDAGESQRRTQLNGRSFSGIADDLDCAF